jgi:hypothetical protein
MIKDAIVGLAFNISENGRPRSSDEPPRNPLFEAKYSRSPVEGSFGRRRREIVQRGFEMLPILTNIAAVYGRFPVFRNDHSVSGRCMLDESVFV